MARLTSIVVDSPVHVRVDTRKSENGHFFVLSFNDGDLRLILPGNNGEAVCAAREIAGALGDAADALLNTRRLEARRTEAFSEAAMQDAADSRD